MWRTSLFLPPAAVLAAVALAASACGPTGGGDVRVSVLGTREGSYLDAGGVDLGSNVFVSQALVRLGRVSVSSDADALTRETPLYVNLFEEALVLQGGMGGSEITEVTVDVPAPEGDGVLPGEPVSVFAAGSIDGVWFEYRDSEMATLTVEGEGKLGEHTTLEVEIQIDLKDWFDGIDSGMLDTYIKPSGGPCFYIDAGRNADAQMQIEESIRDSLSIEAEELDVED